MDGHCRHHGWQGYGGTRCADGESAWSWNPYLSFPCYEKLSEGGYNGQTWHLFRGTRYVLGIFVQNNACSYSEDEYQTLYAEFTQAVPRSVVIYFNNNWHGIRNQWMEELKNASANFLNNTNNRLESTNQKIKEVVSRYSRITVFFQDLMLCIRSLKKWKGPSCLICM